MLVVDVVNTGSTDGLDVEEAADGWMSRRQRRC
jgi:hypothetical protein